MSFFLPNKLNPQGQRCVDGVVFALRRPLLLNGSSIQKLTNKHICAPKKNRLLTIIIALPVFVSTSYILYKRGTLISQVLSVLDSQARQLIFSHDLFIACIFDSGIRGACPQAHGQEPGPQS